MPFESFMRIALEEATLAAEKGEIPVGAVIELDGSVISRAHNLRETVKDPTAHAEILAMRAAAEVLDAWRLRDCTLYVTLEPCPMCAGAISQARLKTLVYGCNDPKTGAAGTLYNIVQDERLNHRVEVFGGVLEKECSIQLRDFFADRR